MRPPSKGAVDREQDDGGDQSVNLGSGHGSRSPTNSLGLMGHRPPEGATDCGACSRTCQEDRQVGQNVGHGCGPFGVTRTKSLVGRLFVEVDILVEFRNRQADADFGNI